MDLSLYSRVLWRWRNVVVVGLVAAVALAVLSVYKPSVRNGVPELTQRTSELWRSEATVYLTYPGFPAGGTALTPDPLQFNRIAALYASLANSDIVRRKVLAGGVDGYYTAIPTADRTYGETTLLPMVTLLGHATTPESARKLAGLAAAGLVSYVRGQQKAAGIAESQRVAIRLLNAPREPVNIQPRKKTLPIVVLLAVLMATIGLAFVLENLKRGVRPAETERTGATLEEVEPPRERVEPPSEIDEPQSWPEEAPVRAAHRWG